MKSSMRRALIVSVSLATVFAGCSSSDESGSRAGAAAAAGSGGSGGGSGSAGVGGASAGAAGSSAGSAASAGSGGVAGTAGSAGSATGGSAGTAGTGGMTVVVPAEVLIDSIYVRAKSESSAGGAGGSGGADAGGAGGGGGAADAGAGGAIAAGGAGLGGNAAAGAAGATGAGGGISGYVRSYEFDTTLEGWALHAHGSTPNIGVAGGAEKLSAKSTLAFNDDDGSPSPGSLKLTIPFTSNMEQLDVHQLFDGAGDEEDWSGLEVVARIKLLTDGDMDGCLAAWLYATSTDYAFGRGPELPLAEGDWATLAFDLAAPDTAGDRPSNAGFDAAQINQLGIHVHSYECP